MTFMEFCRNKAYWAMDTLRGGKVRKSLDLLEQIEGGIMSDEQVEKYHQEQVKKLLDHTRKTVAYYASMSSLSLAEWPVVNKASIKNSQESFFSNQFNRSQLIEMSTSGSTGTPFRCYQNIEKKRHVNAEVLYYNGQIDYKIGRKIIYFRSIVGEVQKNALQQFAQNICLLDCKDLSDQGIEKKLDIIRKESQHGGAMIMGYCSTLDAFRRYFQKYGTNKAEGCNIYGIIGGSEIFHDITRDVLEKAFKCKCVSRYSNEENGFIGQDDEIRNVFIPNRANYIVEILKLNSNEPVFDGEVGRVVITDLYNYAMPMIRYDTGDVGAWQEVNHKGCKRKAIGSFSGRVVDMIFDCNGNQISPHSITNLMWSYQGIKQYQFIQKGKAEYTMRINLGDFELDEESVKRDLKRIVGEEASVIVEYTDEIPVLASGKRRYIKNEMNL